MLCRALACRHQAAGRAGAHERLSVGPQHPIFFEAGHRGTTSASVLPIRCIYGAHRQPLWTPEKVRSRSRHANISIAARPKSVRFHPGSHNRLQRPPMLISLSRHPNSNGNASSIHYVVDDRGDFGFQEAADRHQERELLRVQGLCELVNHCEPAAASFASLCCVQSPSSLLLRASCVYGDVMRANIQQRSCAVIRADCGRGAPPHSIRQDIRERLGSSFLRCFRSLRGAAVERTRLKCPSGP